MLLNLAAQPTLNGIFNCELPTYMVQWKIIKKPLSHKISIQMCDLWLIWETLLKISCWARLGLLDAAPLVRCWQIESMIGQGQTGQPQHQQPPATNKNVSCRQLIFLGRHIPDCCSLYSQGGQKIILLLKLLIHLLKSLNSS